MRTSTSQKEDAWRRLLIDAAFSAKMLGLAKILGCDFSEGIDIRGNNKVGYRHGKEIRDCILARVRLPEKQSWGK